MYQSITVPLQIFFLFQLLRLVSKPKVKKNVEAAWLGTVLKITCSDGEVFNQTR